MEICALLLNRKQTIYGRVSEIGLAVYSIRHEPALSPILDRVEYAGHSNGCRVI